MVNSRVTLYPAGHLEATASGRRSTIFITKVDWLTIQNLHERALADSVLAHEGMYFAGPDAKVNALKNAYARKAFADLAYFQNRPIAFCSFVPVFVLVGHSLW
jgi:hypothetical protein